ncbi:MAG: hypothetical protein AAFO95_16390, partial [Cyanobacteria bacterium J06600_6]
KDFGVWINVVIGIIFSSLLLKQIYQYLFTENNLVNSKSVYDRDLVAAFLAIGVYILYLLAYIPLEYTYRLGKLAISLIYPLAMLGILPAILWFRDRYYRYYSHTFKVICLTLVTLHVFLHIEKIMSPRSLPLGTYSIIPNQNIRTIKELTIVGCKNTSFSQKYERLLALDLGKKHPELNINVVSNSDFNSQSHLSATINQGIDIKHNDENLCLFEIKL